MTATGGWRYLWVVALLSAAACGTPQPSANGSAEPVADHAPTAAGPGRPVSNPPPTDGPQDPVVDCAPPAEPGPGDVVPSSGEDPEILADYGVARWRLCFTAPILGSAEGRGVCLWTPDRQSVDAVNGWPVRVGGIDYGSQYFIPDREFELNVSNPVERWTADYLPTADLPSGVATEDGRVGRLTFDVTLAWDYQDAPPARLPPRLVGLMHWICGDPPPPG